MIEDYLLLDRYISLLERLKSIPKPVSDKRVYTLNQIRVKSFYDKLVTTNFFQICIVGYQGSGKTTTAYYITKQLQLLDDFVVIHSKSFSINHAHLNMIREKYNTNNLVFILDDASYIVSAMGKTEASKFKNFIASVRHLFKGRVFLIIITHVEGGIPPILRNTEAWIYTAITDENNTKNIDNRVINLFNQLRHNNVVETDDYRISLGNDERVVLVKYEGNVSINSVPYTSNKELKNYEVFEEYIKESE